MTVVNRNLICNLGHALTSLLFRCKSMSELLEMLLELFLNVFFELVADVLGQICEVCWEALRAWINCEILYRIFVIVAAIFSSIGAVLWLISRI
jgi:hypothetical protein